MAIKNLRSIVYRDVHGHENNNTETLNSWIKNDCIAYLRDLGWHSNKIEALLTEKNLNWVYEDAKVRFINSKKDIAIFYHFFVFWLIMTSFMLLIRVFP